MTQKSLSNQQESSYKTSRMLTHFIISLSNLNVNSGVPAVVDLAAMRDAMTRLGGNPEKINPLCPVDLVIDHSIQVDVAGTSDAIDKNEELEFYRN